jgi:hypothetical protein
MRHRRGGSSASGTIGVLLFAAAAAIVVSGCGRRASHPAAAQDVASAEHAEADGQRSPLVMAEEASELQGGGCEGWTGTRLSILACLALDAIGAHLPGALIPVAPVGSTSASAHATHTRLGQSWPIWPSGWLADGERERASNTFSRLSWWLWPSAATAWPWSNETTYSSSVQPNTRPSLTHTVPGAASASATASPVAAAPASSPWSSASRAPAQPWHSALLSSLHGWWRGIHWGAVTRWTPAAALRWGPGVALSSASSASWAWWRGCSPVDRSCCCCALDTQNAVGVATAGAMEEASGCGAAPTAAQGRGASVDGVCPLPPREHTELLLAHAATRERRRTCAGGSVVALVGCVALLLCAALAMLVRRRALGLWLPGHGPAPGLALRPAATQRLLWGSGVCFEEGGSQQRGSQEGGRQEGSSHGHGRQEHAGDPSARVHSPV